MKKTFILIALALLTSASLFAEHTFHIGLDGTLSALGNVGMEDTKLKRTMNPIGYGSFADYTYVASGGFTFKVELGAGKAFDKNFTSCALNGSDLNLGLGFGGSFIRNKKMTLSLTGDTGIRILVLEGSTKSPKYSEKASSVLFYAGPEISFTYRFTDSIGVFANLGTFYNFGACSRVINGDRDNLDSYVSSGFSVIPKAGLSITL